MLIQNILTHIIRPESIHYIEKNVDRTLHDIESKEITNDSSHWPSKLKERSTNGPHQIKYAP